MDAEKVVQRDLTWLQKHERLLIVLLFVILVLFLGNKYLDRSAESAKVIAALAQKQLDEQKASNAQIAQQNQQTAAQYQVMVENLTRQNAALASAMAARDNALKNQQNTNQTLPLPELAQRWQAVTGIRTGITATPAGIAVDDGAARQTVNELEKVPVLTANLADESKTAQNTQAELGKANGLIGGLHEQIGGLTLQVGEEEKTCKAKLDTARDDARKSKRNWFIAGVVVGFFGRIAAAAR